MLQEVVCILGQNWRIREGSAAGKQYGCSTHFAASCRTNSTLAQYSQQRLR